MLDQSHAVSQQSKIHDPKYIDLEFPEGQGEQDIETNSPYQHEIIDHKYNRPTEAHYRDSSELQRQGDTSKVIHKLT